MRIFVTGATGFIGTALVPKLIKAGHSVVGLARSETAIAALRAVGADAQPGNVEDLESLRKGADNSDGVIHLAFNYVSGFQKASEEDRKAIEAIGEALVGSNRPFVISSVIAAATSVNGQPITEDSPLAQWNPRTPTEIVVKELAESGVNTSLVRMGVVHDTHKQAFVSFAVQIARQKGKAAYIGDGSVWWSAVHVSDVALLYRLAFDKAEAGSIYHGVDEQGVSMKEIAEAVGRGLKVPVASITPDEAEAHFGWLAFFMGLNLSASSAVTRKKLNWKPTGPGLIADLDAMDYAQV